MDLKCEKQINIEKEIIKNINTFFNSHYFNILINDSDIKILSYFLRNKYILKYIHIRKEIKRKISYILNHSKEKFLHSKEHISLNNNKYFISLVYIYISIIVEKQKNKIEDKNELSYILSLNDIFKYSIILYKNDLLYFHTFFLFFEFYFELIKNFNIYLQQQIKDIVCIINIVKKIVKISKYLLKDETEKKLINEDIRNIFEKIFIIKEEEKLKDFKFYWNLSKHKEIMGLIKFLNDYYEDNIIDFDNKIYLKNILVKLFSNRLNHNHLEYFYNLSKKYLYNLDDSIINQKYISLFNGIIDFLLEIYKNELLKAKSNIYYCDKYFIFDSSFEKYEIRTSPIIFNNKIDLGFTIIFSFASFKSNDNDNRSQIIMSINNEENNTNILEILLINNKLYYYIKSEEKKIVIKEDIKNNNNYLCFIYYDQVTLNFCINNDNRFYEESNLLKNVKKLYIVLGSSNGSCIFNGIMGPLLLFDSIINNQYDLFFKITNILKGKYYLLGETFYKRNLNNNNDYIYFSYEEYFGGFNIDIDELNNMKKTLGNILLYLNPDVFLYNLDIYNQNKIRDFQIYNYLFIESNNNKFPKCDKIFYSFNTNNRISDYISKENNIFDILINNHGYNYIILYIECIFHSLIILNENNLQQNNYEMM